MRTFHRFIRFINIQPGEERLIGLLVLLYFILVFGVVFVQSMAFSVFLAEYSVQGLPYSYLSIALFASVVAALYIKLGERVPFPKLLTFNLIFLGSISLLLWLALNSPLFHVAAFVLPLWFQLAINLANLAVWPLAGNLFDFRQGKRLFPVLGAGNWLANIIGGLFIPALVKSIGAVHLLLLSAISFSLSLLVLRVIVRAYLQAPPQAPPAQRVPRARGPARPAQTSTRIFKDRYILLIVAYVALWWVAFYFVDNIFYNRAFARFPDADQLTAFVGRLLSLLGIIALISSTILTSRIIARFGLRAGLIGMPLVVIISLSILALCGSLGAPLFLGFALATFAKLINLAFGFSLSQSANAIVYQSLPDTVRVRVQATAEGVVQPIAIGLAGLSLLALTAGLKFDFVGLAYVFVGLGVGWLIVIFLLSGNYVPALTRVITKRRLGDDANVLADPDSIALLRNRLYDGQASVVIYALNRLETLDEQAVLHALPKLVRHPAPEVRREALLRIEKRRLRAALSDVREQYLVETIPAVKECALRALGAIAEDTSPLIHAFHERDTYALRGALVGLLKYGHKSAAEQKLGDLLASSSNVERNLGIEVLGELNRRDTSPYIIAALDSPKTSRAAGLALTSIGAEALPEIELAFCDPQASRQRLSALARVLGRIGGVHSQKILLTRLSIPDPELRSHILHALSQSGFRANDRSVIRRALQTELEQAAWVSAAQVDLGEAAETALLTAALTQFLMQIRDRMLLLLSFTFQGDSIRHVHETLRAGSGRQVSYALEIMDAELPMEWKKMIMPLLEGLSPQERNQRFSKFFPQTEGTPEERLYGIIENEQLSYWVRACAAHAAHARQKGEHAMLSTVEKVLILKSVPMFSQTPDNVLADVTNLLEEMDVPENETIFKKGDQGDSLYVILDGKVRVHDGERLLNTLGERDVFGEMALLDTEPRSATVTTVEPTRLFRLDQIPFYELMEERPEIATGIIRILTGRLRNRESEVAPINVDLKALESGSLN